MGGEKIKNKSDKQRLRNDYLLCRVTSIVQINVMVIVKLKIYTNTSQNIQHMNNISLKTLQKP